MQKLKPVTSPPAEAYWTRPVQELVEELSCTTAGLSSADAAARLARYGPNVLQAKRKTSALGLFLNQLKSPIVLILLFATFVSALLQDWADAAIILAIVLGSALLSFTQERNASNAAEKLRAQVSIKATVLRDGAPRQVASEEIAPGDVVLLSAGSLIPADGVLVEAKDFFVNQAVLTGETFPVEKKPGVAAADASLAERTNCVFMGANVRSGSATVLIVQTGAATAFGQIAGRLTLRPPETEFERGIKRLGYLLSEVMLLLVLAIFAVNVALHKPVLDSLLFSVALAVGLTPQLLPAIINTSLSRGSQAMARSGVIVRRLASIENFGSMNVLCTDKTGTLTEGVIKLDGALDVQGQPSDAVLRLAYLNAHFQTGLANPLDEAILAQQAPDIAGVAKIDEIPYDFVRKRLSVVFRENAAPGSAEPPVLVTKGALEEMLAISSYVQSGADRVALDDEQRGQIRQRYADWSAQGYRVLGVASRPMAAKEAYDRNDEQELTFDGFLLFFDPPKQGVEATVADLARLGVQLKIITGDNELVARHVADTLGLEVAGVMTGHELGDMPDEALWQAAGQTSIFAAVDPNQKERIILALQKTGYVVGYMGDGINDAPALHAADVGISVDSAVDVAKDAADFVLLKHDLSVLHQGIIEGRTTFGNTLKYVFMATGANFGNMVSMAGASLLLPFLPMLPKQILLINFMTDLPEMTISADNVDPGVIDRPRRWDIDFIRRFMLVFGPLSSVFDFATFGVLVLLLKADERTFHTGWFIESVFSAALVVFVLRTRQPIRRSRPGRGLVLATLGTLAITLLIPYSPLAKPLGFAPLPLPYLLLIGVIVLGYLASARFARDYFYRWDERRNRRR